MISAFVVGNPTESLQYHEALNDTLVSLELGQDIVDDTTVPLDLRSIIPHPLTGFSMQLLISVGKVGSLCRMRHNEIEQFNGDRAANFEEKAEIIELELFNHRQTHHSNFKDPQDPQTNINEILSVGEAYRCAGLLQLYTRFPQLLQRHAWHAENGFEASFSLEMEAFSLNSIGQFTPLQHNWLRALAFHICQILDTIPPTSPTRVLQGLVVLIAASWLVDSVTIDQPTPDEGSFNHPEFVLTNSSTPKEYWREKVRCGLRLHNEYVGLEQVCRILNIVEDIWQLDDGGSEKCDWMVVVASKGLQTLYG
jgi:hypothetical protein